MAIWPLPATTATRDASAAKASMMSPGGVGIGASAHSITVDPFTGDVFVPLAGILNGVSPCPTSIGCIAVFSQVPGPIVGAGVPGLIAACGALLALVRRRRRQFVA
jgi:hypothetical protein